MSGITPIRRALKEGAPLKRLGGTWGEVLAEFLGTFTMLVIGYGTVAMAVAALPGSGRAATDTTIFMAAGDWMLIAWGWAFAVTFGIYIAGGITGAHLNPAVTLAMAIRRNFAWKKVLPYWIAQVVGAFVAAALIYAIYHQAIDAFNLASHTTRSAPGGLPTFSIFATFPAPYFHGSNWGPLLDQIVGTAVLLGLIAAVTDDRNMGGFNKHFAPLMVGLIVAAIGIAIGANAGYAINPARDFGSRFFTWLVGWGQMALPGTIPGQFHDYFWVPIVGPLIGGVIGIFVYDFFIGDIIHSRAASAAADEAEHATREAIAHSETGV